MSKRKTRASQDRKQQQPYGRHKFQQKEEQPEPEPSASSYSLVLFQGRTDPVFDSYLIPNSQISNEQRGSLSCVHHKLANGEMCEGLETILGYLGLSGEGYDNDNEEDNNGTDEESDYLPEDDNEEEDEYEDECEREEVEEDNNEEEDESEAIWQEFQTNGMMPIVSNIQYVYFINLFDS